MSKVTVKALADLVKQITGFTGEITFDTTKPNGTMQKCMDSSRLNQLGGQFTLALDDGLEVAYEDFKEQKIAAK